MVFRLIITASDLCSSAILLLHFLSFSFWNVLLSRCFTSAARLSVSSTTTSSSWSTACGTPECFIQEWAYSWERSCFSRVTCHSTGRASTSSTTPLSWATQSTFTRRWVCVICVLIWIESHMLHATVKPTLIFIPHWEFESAGRAVNHLTDQLNVVLMYLSQMMY